MSWALSPAARDDVEIEYGSIPEPSSGAAQLWRSLQATCADAAQKELWELAQASIFFGCIRKRFLPSSSTPAMPLLQRPWGAVSPSWTSPTMLDPFIAAAVCRLPSGRHEDEALALTQLAEDLKQRIAAFPDKHSLPLNTSSFTALGALCKRGVFFLRRHSDIKLVDVYLFEHKLVFVVTDPLQITGVLPLADIVDVALHFEAECDFEIYRIELSVQSHSDVVERWEMFTQNPPEQLIPAWSAALCQLVAKARRFDAEEHAGAPAMGAFVTDPPDALFEDMRALRMYAPAQIQSGGQTTSCSAYLFADALLFIYKDLHGALHVHNRIALADVEFVYDGSLGESCVVGMSVVEEVRGLHLDDRTRARADYAFGLRTRELVADWLRALERRSLELHPDRPPIRVHSHLGQLESTSQWHLAGLVFLVAPPASNDAEYNIGVAVLPHFASDGLATYAIADVLRKAFDSATLGSHRIQARILRTDAPESARALRTFLHLGFTHEGTRRRAASLGGTWADVSVLALLDTDWQVRRHVRQRALGLWDEMLERQQRESDLLALASGRNLNLKRKRTGSPETVVPAPRRARDTFHFPSSSRSEAASAGWEVVPETSNLELAALRPRYSAGQQTAAERERDS